MTVNRRMLGGVLIALTCGCAHHRQDYAYAPPYAPPVYPQPHAAVQPVANVAAPGTVAGAAPAGMVLPGPAAAVQTQPCAQPCPEGMAAGSFAAGPVVVEGGQTPPCPPGP